MILQIQIQQIPVKKARPSDAKTAITDIATAVLAIVNGLAPVKTKGFLNSA